MVVRLLSLCGLDLGPKADLLPPRPDNEEGFYENRRFVAVSDQLLGAHPGERVVTRYDAYFHEPEAELTRRC